MNYIDNHEKLSEYEWNFPNQYYIQGTCEKTYHLQFKKEWADQNLPINSDHDSLRYNLLDTKSNQIYSGHIYSAYEKYNEYQILMRYFYSDHQCPCHRHYDAIKYGLNENKDDVKCEGDRFLIESITPANSDLILLSETKSFQELVDLLHRP